MISPPNDAYWQTREGAAFNAISELCNPDASLNERLEAATLLRKAFGMPTAHSPECGVNDPDLDEPDASDCNCGYWEVPRVAEVVTEAPSHQEPKP